LLDVRLDGFLVHLGVVLIGQQDHDDVGALDRLADVGDLGSARLRLVPGRAALAQADADLDPRFLQVERMGVALRAVAEDGDLLALDEREIGVLVVINFHNSPLSPSGLQTRSTRLPRPGPLVPVRTVSMMLPGSSAWMNASSLRPSPVSSMV